MVVRRRHGDAPGRRPVPAHHDHRQRRDGPGLDGGVAADRVAAPAGATAPRSPSSGRRSPLVGPRSRDVLAAARPRAGRGQRRVPVHDLARRRGRRACAARVCRISFSGELAFEVNVSGLGRAGAVGGAAGGRGRPRHHAVRHRDHARAAGREGLPDRRPGHRRHGHPARPRAWPGWCRRRRPTSSASGPSPARTTSARTASTWSALLPVDRDAAAARGRPARRPLAAAARAAGADAGPRDLQLPQRGARPDVRAGPGQAAAASGSARRCTRRSAAGWWPSPSPNPCCTTPKEPVVMAETTTARQPARPPAGGPRRRSRPRVRLRELPFLTQLNLRLDPARSGGGGRRASRWAHRCRRGPTRPSARGDVDGALARARRVAGGRPARRRRRSWRRRCGWRWAPRPAPSSTSRRTGRRSSSRATGPARCSPRAARWTCTRGSSARGPARRPCWRRRRCCCWRTGDDAVVLAARPRLVRRPTWPTGSWTRAVSTQRGDS